MLGLLSKFTFSRLKVAWELLSSFYCYQYLPQMVLYTNKLYQKKLWRNLATVNLKLRKESFLLRVQQKYFELAF